MKKANKNNDLGEIVNVLRKKSNENNDLARTESPNHWNPSWTSLKTIECSEHRVQRVRIEHRGWKAPFSQFRGPESLRVRRATRTAIRIEARQGRILDKLPLDNPQKPCYNGGFRVLYGWLNGGATVTKCGFFILESPFSTVKKFSRHTVTRGIVQILFAILATLSTLTQPLFYGSLYYNGLWPLWAL